MPPVPPKIPTIPLFLSDSPAIGEEIPLRPEEKHGDYSSGAALIDSEGYYSTPAKGAALARANDWESEASRLKLELQSARQDLERNNFELQTVQAQAARLQKERDSFRKRVNAMEDFYKIEGGIIEDLERMNNLEKELAKAQAANADKDARIRDLTDQNKSLSNDMKRLEVDFGEKLLHMDVRLKASSQEIELLRSRVRENQKKHGESLDGSQEALVAHSELLSRLDAVISGSREKVQQQGQKLAAQRAFLLRDGASETGSSTADGEEKTREEKAKVEKTRGEKTRDEKSRDEQSRV